MSNGINFFKNSFCFNFIFNLEEEEAGCHAGINC